MIRRLVDQAFNSGKYYISAVGLSTDVKPTEGIITGSKFVEVDTGIGYLFDETSGEWHKNQQLSAAVQAYFEDHPEAIDQAAIEAMFGEQLDGIEENIGGLKSAFGESLDGIQFFGQYVPFDNYGLNSDGTYKTEQQYRVSCATHIILERSISIAVKNGFKWGYIPFVNNTAKGWSGWTTVPMALPSGIEFVVQIARVTENTSEIANVNEFVSALSFRSVLGDEAYKTAYDVNNEYIQFTSGDVTYGNWEDGGYVDYNFIRNCVAKLIDVKKGDKLIYKTNNLQIGFGVFVNGVSTDYTGWLSAATETEYIFQRDGQFYAQFRKSSNDVVEPYEFDAECKLYRGIRYDVTQNTKNINALRDQIGAYEYACKIVDGTPPNPANTQCVYTSNLIPVEYMSHVSLKTQRPLDSGADRYIFGVYGYNSSGTIIMSYSPTNRIDLTSDFVVTYANIVGIRYSITEVDSSNNIISIRASSFTGYETVVNVDAGADYYQYKYTGEHLNIKQNHYNMIQTSLMTPTTETVGAGALQGFAMYDGLAVQFYSNPSKLAIINMSNNTVLATVAGNVEHGNTVDFFNEFESISDIFPLALVADGLTNTAYKVRIQTSGVTVKQTIKFPVENCGYYVSTMLDKLNNIIYTVGYYENSYNTNSGTNKMIIAKWDYTTLTNNGDGSVTPAFIESFYVPYFTTLQGPTFYNGKLFVVSSKSSSTEADTVVYVIDPVAKRVCSLISDFDWHIKDLETEGIFFYNDSNQISAFMKNSDTGQPYYKLVFGE